MFSRKSVSIRRAQPSDCHALLELWKALLDEQEQMEGRFERADDAEERWRNDYEEWLRDDEQRIFVAERKGEVSGYVSACRWFTSPIYKAARELFIEEMYVAPDRRRKGIGRALLAAVQEWAEETGIERLRIGVLAQNQDGRAFWEALAATPLSLTLTVELDKGAAESSEKEKEKASMGF